VMNPPFERGADIDHVRKAYAMLRHGVVRDGDQARARPAGRLVAIMSEGPFFRDDAKSQQFREWLQEVGGTSQKLPAKSFNSSERPTGVSSRVVVIDGPSENM